MTRATAPDLGRNIPGRGHAKCKDPGRAGKEPSTSEGRKNNHSGQSAGVNGTDHTGLRPCGGGGAPGGGGKTEHFGTQRVLAILTLLSDSITRKNLDFGELKILVTRTLHCFLSLCLNFLACEVLRARHTVRVMLSS